VQTVEDNGDPLRCDRHRFEWPVDRITSMISLEEYEAAKKCQWAYFASQGHARIGDYGSGVGGSDPSRRLGLTPEQEQAGRVWRVYWAAMNPVVKAIVLNFVLQQPPRGWDRPMTEVEFGREYGKSKHEATARGVAQGALRTACSVLREIEIAGGHTSWRDLQREVRARRMPARITNEEMAILQGRERQLVRA
jgi:hypothetical protein